MIFYSTVAETNRIVLESEFHYWQLDNKTMTYDKKKYDESVSNKLI